MRIETYKCDACGAEKRDSNHWWSLYRADHEKRIVVVPLDAEFPHRPGQTICCRESSMVYKRFHLCGEACVTKKLSEFMSPARPAVEVQP